MAKGILMTFTTVAVVTGAMAWAGTPPSPVGKTLPSVGGRNLAGEKIRFPERVLGSPSVLLVAYRRGTQPDTDRWIEFLARQAPGTAFFEVPTISNPLWRPLSGWIDSGMRGGVPREKWPLVVTLYEEAPLLRDFLGDRGGLSTHVVLLDGAGRVAWFDAGGFSTAGAESLLAALLGLGRAP
jgi:hypothetical protein